MHDNICAFHKKSEVSKCTSEISDELSIKILIYKHAFEQLLSKYECVNDIEISLININYCFPNAGFIDAKNKILNQKHLKIHRLHTSKYVLEAIPI